MASLVAIAFFATTFPLSISSGNAETDAPLDSPSKRSEAAFNSGLDSLSDLGQYFQQSRVGDAKDMAGVTQLTSETLRKVQALTANEERALEAAGWLGILDPERIRSDVGCRNSRALIDLANLTTNRRSLILEEGMKALGRHIESSQLNAELKAKMLDENRRSSSRALEISRRRFELERQIIATTAEATDILCSPDAWLIEGDAILFHADSDLNRYNAAMERLDGLHVQLGDVDAKIAERGEAAAESVQGAAREAAPVD